MAKDMKEIFQVIEDHINELRRHYSKGDFRYEHLILESMDNQLIKIGKNRPNAK